MLKLYFFIVLLTNFFVLKYQKNISNNKETKYVFLKKALYNLKLLLYF